jgi:imidazolonepropionase-like amidohydrolase
VPYLRRTGVTALCLVPRGGGAGGRASVARLTAEGLTLLDEEVGLVLSVGAATGAGSSDARAASVKSLAMRLDRAVAYRKEWNNYERDLGEWETEHGKRKGRRKDKEKPRKPRHRDDMEVWSRVADGKLRLIVEVHRAETAGALLDLLSGRRIPAALVGCTECAELAERLGSLSVPVLLHPLASPLPEERFGEAPPDLPARLVEEGAFVAASPAGPWPSSPLWLSTAASAMAAASLDPEDSIGAVTGAAARALGMEDRLGVIEPGRLADLVVWSGHPLDPQSWPRSVLVGGEVVEGKLP